MYEDILIAFKVAIIAAFFMEDRYLLSKWIENIRKRELGMVNKQNFVEFGCNNQLNSIKMYIVG